MNDGFSGNLCCPVCKSALNACSDQLQCIECEKSYPVINGRPILVPWLNSNPESAQMLLDAARILGGAGGSAVVDNKAENIQDYFHDHLFPKLDRREPHWRFLGNQVSRMVSCIPKNSKVLDVGAGECQYGDLLRHCDYLGTDLVFSSDKHNFTQIKIVSDAQSLPFARDSFDVVLNMVVMEHVPEPEMVVREMFRVLRKGGTVFAMIPLVRPEHLVPFDFFRFTRYGIKHIFEKAGFEVKEILPSNGALWTALSYASLISLTEPLKKYGRRTIRGILLNRMWWLIYYPLLMYAKKSDPHYGKDFPMYYWVKAEK